VSKEPIKLDYAVPQVRDFSGVVRTIRRVTGCLAMLNAIGLAVAWFAGQSVAGPNTSQNICVAVALSAGAACLLELVIYYKFKSKIQWFPGGANFVLWVLAGASIN
jgi:hypothetical protein